MTVDYPPSTTYTLASALEDVETDLEEARQRLEDLQDDDDAKRSAIAKANSKVSKLKSRRNALRWAIHGDDREDGFDGWGEGAEVRLTAFTAQSRARAIDTINNKTMGTVGAEETRVWLIAASLDTAPWLDEDDDLEGDYRNTGSLPPALQDWLDVTLEDLNDLTPGN